MSFTWTGQPPSQQDPDLADADYCVWKFRQRAGLAHQIEDYEGALSDETIIDMMHSHSIEFGNIDYFQPLTTLAAFIEADPEQRMESYEGDAKDKWTDPYKRAMALRKEQEYLNRNAIPGYFVQPFFPGPILTNWGG